MGSAELTAEVSRLTTAYAAAYDLSPRLGVQRRLYCLRPFPLSHLLTCRRLDSVEEVAGGETLPAFKLKFGHFK